MPTNKKNKILIADDDHDFVEILRTFLESQGYQTFAAYEGVRTVEIANKKKPDLILLDLSMPAGKGDSVLQMLRLREATRNIPVIVITGLPKPNLKKKILSMGANAYFQKPFDEKELLARIEALLCNPS